MQRAHKRKIKVLVVDAAMMFAAVQMTVCMHGKQRYTASAQDVSGYEVSIEDNTQTAGDIQDRIYQHNHE